MSIALMPSVMRLTRSHIITNNITKGEFVMYEYNNYGPECCVSCGSDDVITLSNDDGSEYEHCKECQHDEEN